LYSVCGVFISVSIALISCFLYRYLEVTLLSILATSYIPLQARERSINPPVSPIQEIGIAFPTPFSSQRAEEFIRVISAIEESKRVAKGEEKNNRYSYIVFLFLQSPLEKIYIYLYIKLTL